MIGRRWCLKVVTNSMLVLHAITIVFETRFEIVCGLADGMQQHILAVPNGVDQRVERDDFTSSLEENLQQLIAAPAPPSHWPTFTKNSLILNVHMERPKPIFVFDYG